MGGCAPRCLRVVWLRRSMLWIKLKLEHTGIVALLYVGLCQDTSRPIYACRCHPSGRSNYCIDTPLQDAHEVSFFIWWRNGIRLLTILLWRSYRSENPFCLFSLYRCIIGANCMSQCIVDPRFLFFFWLLVLVLYCEYPPVYYDPIKLTQLLALVSWSRSRSLSLNHSISFIPLLRVVSLTASGDGAWTSMAHARRDSKKNFYSSSTILLQCTMGSLHRFGYREDPEITPILLKLHVFFPIGEILQETILTP